MGHVMNPFKSVPDRRFHLVMLENEYVLLVNGNTRIVVCQKTASVDDELIGFAI